VNGGPLRRSATLRAKLALIRGAPYAARATRFRDRQLNDDVPTLDAASVMAVPDWLLSSEEQQIGLAKAIAILLHRPAIDSELSGTKLAALSDAVGEELFDDLCDHRLTEEMPEPVSRDLPRPEDLEAIGRDHMQRAIPIALSAQFAEARGDQLSAKLCTTAARVALHRVEQS
jgi:hypothetical protein